MLRSGRQRVRQFLQASRRPTDADLSLGQAYLDGRLCGLFVGQEPRDIVHAVNTARWLLERGHHDRELVQAALLHDIGKGLQRTRDRVVYVLASRAGAANLLASAESRLQARGAVARSLIHSEAGAEMLEAAGASPAVVRLTRLHHSALCDDAMLALLQEADAAS
jgi:putative nucleotidyltransferase with HDIG domain